MMMHDQPLKMKESLSDFIAAFTAAAITGTYQWYTFIDVKVYLLDINWVSIIAHVVESVPVILVSGFLGVMVKKLAEDAYAWMKKGITKKTKSNKDGDSILD